MISNTIVLAGLLLGGFYCGLWLLKKDFRRQVEQPKYNFLRQVDAAGNQAGVDYQGKEQGKEQDKEARDNRHEH